MEFYTRGRFRTERSATVSIPNGMEFYLQRYLKGAGVWDVSIPNGMEFYKFKAKCMADLKSFNSQRDGILQSSVFNSLALAKVFQFPTGWNSTQSSKECLFLYHVSIPNGMEFYLISLSKLRIEESFNSQRDGILLFRNYSFFSSFSFQFPTGWNSTRHSKV